MLGRLGCTLRPFWLPAYNALPPGQTASQSTPVVEVLLYVHRNRRLIRDGSPGRPPLLSPAPELCLRLDVELWLVILTLEMEAG